MAPKHIIGHFSVNSFLAVDCTGTDNQTQQTEKIHKNWSRYETR